MEVACSGETRSKVRVAALEVVRHAALDPPVQSAGRLAPTGSLPVMGLEFEVLAHHVIQRVADPGEDEVARSSSEAWRANSSYVAGLVRIRTPP